MAKRLQLLRNPKCIVECSLALIAFHSAVNLFPLVYPKTPTYDTSIIITISAIMLKLHGHFISQPARSVLWLLKIHHASFDFIKTDPTRGDTKTPNFHAKFPLQRIPVIEDDGFPLAESSAIMMYLCEKNKWADYYPYDDLNRKAKIHEYLSCHGEKTRKITIHAFRPVMLYAIGGGNLNEASEAKATKFMNDIGTWFQDTWLSSSRYIAGDTPTIADLSAYTELSQGPLMLDHNYDDLPRLKEWLNDMANEVPFHDEVHRSVFKLRDLIRKKRVDRNQNIKSKL